MSITTSTVFNKKRKSIMSNGYLLWVDDEIELLRAHIIFLQSKGYEVVTVSNGTDAIEECKQHKFDLVLLDEMMPGIKIGRAHV